MAAERKHEIGRRSFLLAEAGLAAAPVLGGIATQANAQGTPSSGTPVAEANGRRRLGSLEVTSLGLGVQNVSRKYDTTVPRDRASTLTQDALAAPLAVDAADTHEKEL